jgi:hypothetical protein
MPLATLGDVQSSQDPRTIDGGAMVLDRVQYHKFKRVSRPVPVAEIQLGDVIEVKRITGGMFKGGALVATVVAIGEQDGKITLNGIRPAAEEIRAIAGGR